MNLVKYLAAFAVGVSLIILLMHSNISFHGLPTRLSILARQALRNQDKPLGNCTAPAQENKEGSAMEPVSKSKQKEAFITNRKRTPSNRTTQQTKSVPTKAAFGARNVFKRTQKRDSVSRSRKVALENMFPARKPYQGDFQRLDDRIFIYSAIYETASSSVRTLILVPEPFKSVTFICILKRSRSHIGQRVKGRFQHIPPSGWGTYINRCGFVHCPVPPNTYPAFISVLTTRMSSPINILPVNYPGPPYNNLTRCYPAVHGNFTDVNTLVTALETNRYFGTDKFIFYNYSIPEQVNKVLLQYEREGIVEMRKWRLPFPPEEIHYWGQMASMHDCVFSQLGVAKYVLLADIDEIIVPKNNISLVTLADRRLNTKDPRSQNVYGTLMFQNTFFALYESETKYVFPEKEIAKKLKLRAFLHTKRSDINPPNFRSKLLVKPEAVELLHVHIMEKFLPGWGMYVVNPKVALMHHYRETYDKQSIGPWRQDVTFIKYSSSIIPKITKRLLNLHSRLGLQI